MCRAFYKGKGDLKKVRILSFGFNQSGDIDGKEPGVHAEHNAIDKLITRKNKKKLESINLLVIRVSSKNKIQYSKPCYNCIEMMKMLPKKKGYKLENIYYSDETGGLIKTNLAKLSLEEKHFSNFWRKRRVNFIS